MAQTPEKRREYYAANKEKIAAQGKEYYAANKEKIVARGKEYRQKNKEKIAAQKKEYRQKNKEKSAVRNQAYYQKNKEKIAEYRQRNRGKLRAASAARRKNLHPSYVTAKLKRQADYRGDIPAELIELKTEQLKMFRLIKEIKNGINGTGN